MNGSRVDPSSSLPTGNPVMVLTFSAWTRPLMDDTAGSSIKWFTFSDGARYLCTDVTECGGRVRRSPQVQHLYGAFIQLNWIKASIGSIHCTGKGGRSSVNYIVRKQSTVHNLEKISIIVTIYLKAY